MKVAFVFNHSDFVGGGEVSFLELVKAIEVEKFILVPGEGKVQEALKGYHVKTVSFPPLILSSERLASILKLFYIIKQLSPDIIHVNGSRAMFYTGFVARALKIPAIFHVRISEPDLPLDFLIAILCSGIIANSKKTASRFRWAKDLRKIQVIYNGVNTKRFRPGISKLKGALGFEGRKVIGTVGRLDKWKRFDIFLKACALIGEKDVGTLVVGDGEARDELEKLSVGLGLKTLFVGQREDVQEFYRLMDMFVMPSPYEHFGRVALEAMACGVPTVVSKSSGVAELIDSGKDGIVVPPHDALAIAQACRKLLRDGSLRSSIGRNAMRKVRRNFVISKHAKDVLRFYKTF